MELAQLISQRTHKVNEKQNLDIKHGNSLLIMVCKVNIIPLSREALGKADMQTVILFVLGFYTRARAEN